MSGKHIFLVVLLIALLAGAALADQEKDQKRREAQLRTVKGQVLDSDDDPIATAVVYLKNTRTLAVKTQITDDHGNYRFSGLDPNVDFELSAKYKDDSSSTRTVSSFDTRKEITLHLKIKTKS